MLSIKAIVLTQGLFALVDAKNFMWLNHYKWSAAKNGNMFYAVRTDLGKGTVFMYREIMGNPKGVQIDHANRYGLDNREQNLRRATCSQQAMNKGKKKGGTSKHRGVCYYKRRKLWQAQIQFEGEHIYLGHHKTEEEAARAYDEAAKELFGEFANLNFPERRSA